MLRRLAHGRAGAAAVAGTLVLAGVGLVALAPVAQAGTVTAQVHCVLPTASGQPPADGPQDVTVDLAPGTVAAGGKVRAKVTLGESPATSPFALTIHAQPTITLRTLGGSDRRVTVTGPVLTIQTEAGKSVPIPPYEGDFYLPADAAVGPMEFGVVEMVTHTWLSPNTSGAPLDTTCGVTEGGDQAVASVTVEGGGTGQPTLVLGTSSTFTGEKVAMTGAGFAPNGRPEPALCNAAGCSTAAFGPNSLEIDGAGNLTGDAPLATNGITTGDYTVQVGDGSKVASAPLHVESHVSTGNRRISLSVASGPVGTVVTVTGEDFDAHSLVRIDEADSTKTPVTGALNVRADGAGRLAPTQYTISSPRTAFIRVRNNNVPVYAAFTLGTVATQTAAVALGPGTLSMTQAGDGITFGSATLNGESQTLTANLNQVTVVDARGGTYGWSLTGTMTDLSAASGAKIPAGNVAWTPACSASTGSLSEVRTGSAGTLGATPMVVCSQAADPTKATGGRFTADAQLVLTTPQFATPGAYSGTIVLSLS